MTRSVNASVVPTGTPDARSLALVGNDRDVVEGRRRGTVYPARRQTRELLEVPAHVGLVGVATARGDLRQRSWCRRPHRPQRALEPQDALILLRGQAELLSKGRDQSTTVSTDRRGDRFKSGSVANRLSAIVTSWFFSVSTRR